MSLFGDVPNSGNVGDDFCGEEREKGKGRVRLFIF
jgi:hypothetical protein